MITTLDLALVIDVVIAITITEGVLLVVFHRLTGRGLAPRDFALNMLSGLCLIVASRCLARDIGVAAVAACLIGAGAAHVTDIWGRFKRARNLAVIAPAALRVKANAAGESTINAHRSAA